MPTGESFVLHCGRDETGRLQAIAGPSSQSENDAQHNVMGNVNKTDKLIARGLATLLRSETLPAAWIAPSEVRDER